jgi:hypothetical protein
VTRTNEAYPSLPNISWKNVLVESQIQHYSIHIVPIMLCCHLKFSGNVLFLGDLENIPFRQRSIYRGDPDLGEK